MATVGHLWLRLLFRVWRFTLPPGVGCDGPGTGPQGPKAIATPAVGAIGITDGASIARVLSTTRHCSNPPIPPFLCSTNVTITLRVKPNIGLEQKGQPTHPSISVSAETLTRGRHVRAKPPTYIHIYIYVVLRGSRT